VFSDGIDNHLSSFVRIKETLFKTSPEASVPSSALDYIHKCEYAQAP